LITDLLGGSDRGRRDGGDEMANPKRRHSKQRTSTRRAHDALTARSLSECPNCHERKLPHRACPKCGYYKGREVVEVKEAS
jgi:large subunit ribosomal protein L32